jgi:hypothetical protein
MRKTIRVGMMGAGAGLALAGALALGSLGGCAVQASGDEKVEAQSAALTCATPSCYGPIESEAVIESDCGDAGVPRDGTLLLQAYPANLRSAGVRDSTYGVLIDGADQPTQCLERLLQTYCYGDRPWESTTTFEGCLYECAIGCPEIEHRIDISECPATVIDPNVTDAIVYEPFVALLASSGCNAYADVFASSEYIIPYQGVYVAYDPVGSGPHKDP